MNTFNISHSNIATKQFGKAFKTTQQDSAACAVRKNSAHTPECCATGKYILRCKRLRLSFTRCCSVRDPPMGGAAALQSLSWSFSCNKVRRERWNVGEHRTMTFRIGIGKVC